MPSNQEQQQVSDFLSLVTERIQKQQALVDNLKKCKRGLSISLFEELIKDKGYSKVLFADTLVLLQNNTFSREELEYTNEGVRNIHYGDVLIKYGASVDVSNTDIPSIKPDRNIDRYKSNSYLQNGDIVFADTAEDYTVGKATEIIGISNQKVLSGLHTIPCRPQRQFAPMYLG